MGLRGLPEDEADPQAILLRLVPVFPWQLPVERADDELEERLLVGLTCCCRLVVLSRRRRRRRDLELLVG